MHRWHQKLHHCYMFTVRGVRFVKLTMVRNIMVFSGLTTDGKFGLFWECLTLHIWPIHVNSARSSLRKQNEHWQWLWPLLPWKWEFCVTRTASILTQFVEGRLGLYASLIGLFFSSSASSFLLVLCCFHNIMLRKLTAITSMNSSGSSSSSSICCCCRSSSD